MGWKARVPFFFIFFYEPPPRPPTPALTVQRPVQCEPKGRGGAAGQGDRALAQVREPAGALLRPLPGRLCRLGAGRADAERVQHAGRRRDVADAFEPVRLAADGEAQGGDRDAAPAALPHQSRPQSQRPRHPRLGHRLQGPHPAADPGPAMHARDRAHDIPPALQEHARGHDEAAGGHVRHQTPAGGLPQDALLHPLAAVSKGGRGVHTADPHPHHGPARGEEAQHEAEEHADGRAAAPAEGQAQDLPPHRAAQGAGGLPERHLGLLHRLLPHAPLPQHALRPDQAAALLLSRPDAVGVGAARLPAARQFRH